MKYLTTSEVAAIIRTSNETVRMLCRTGALDSFQIKKHYRISSDSFEAWIESQRVKPETSEDDGQPSPPRLKKINRVTSDRLSSGRLTPISNPFPNLPKLKW